MTDSTAPVCFVVSCEHGGNRIPPAYQLLFRDHEAVLASHRGYDPGALLMAKAIAQQLDAPLFAAMTSRLLIDLNRSMRHPQLFSEFTRNLPPIIKEKILDHYYRPYRQRVETAIAQAIQRGSRVIHLSSHSFTPQLHGKVRKADIGLLLRQALDKVAFLPFGYLVDQWRWKVFSGEVSPGDYNKAWWQLREKYQNIAPPAPRSENDFDAGAKYHVAGNVPYARYFLAHILQFQFHRALCREAGYKGPLNRCSIYGNKAAGEKLKAMLALGQSKPWPEALKALTGEDKMDATAIIDYFAPLKAWLDEQNKTLLAAK